MEIKTPAFVFDIQNLKDRVKFIREILGDKIKICFAMKANPFLVKEMAELVDSLEVCSPGEFRICEKYRIAPEKIVLSGVYKEKSDIQRIIGICKDKPLYTIESFAQFMLLRNIASYENIILNVCLRLSSGNQFGMDKDTIEKILKIKQNNLHICGIQMYSGTQKKNEKIQNEIKDLDEYLHFLEKEYGFVCERIEYGPGLGVTYFQNETPRDDQKSLEELKDALCFAKDREIMIEMGRFLVAYAGSYHTTIVDMKTNFGVNYIIVDGGINHLNYYGQMMAMKFPFIVHSGKDEKELQNYTICGSLCTTADVLVKNYPLYDAKIGDRLEFQRAGAYSVTEGIHLFLSRDMPYIYKKIGNKLELVRENLMTDILNS